MSGAWCWCEMYRMRYGVEEASDSVGFVTERTRARNQQLDDLSLRLERCDGRPKLLGPAAYVAGLEELVGRCECRATFGRALGASTRAPTLAPTPSPTRTQARMGRALGAALGGLGPLRVVEVRLCQHEQERDGGAWNRTARIRVVPPPMPRRTPRRMKDRRRA